MRSDTPFVEPQDRKTRSQPSSTRARQLPGADRCDEDVAESGGPIHAPCVASTRLPAEPARRRSARSPQVRGGRPRSPMESKEVRAASSCEIPRSSRGPGKSPKHRLKPSHRQPHDRIRITLASNRPPRGLPIHEVVSTSLSFPLARIQVRLNFGFTDHPEIHPGGIKQELSRTARLQETNRGHRHMNATLETLEHFSCFEGILRFPKNLPLRDADGVCSNAYQCRSKNSELSRLEPGQSQDRSSGTLGLNGDLPVIDPGRSNLDLPSSLLQHPVATRATAAENDRMIWRIHLRTGPGGPYLHQSGFITQLAGTGNGAPSDRRWGGHELDTMATGGPEYLFSLPSRLKPRS